MVSVHAKNLLTLMVTGLVVVVERFDRLGPKRGAVVLVWGAAAGVLVLLLGFPLVRAPLERAALAFALRDVTGCDVELDAVRHDSDGLTLLGMHVHTRGGAALLDAAQAALALHGRVVQLTLDGPRFAFLPDRLRGDEWRRFLDGVAHRGLDSYALEVEVRGGTLAIATDSVPTLAVLFRDVDGTLHLSTHDLGYVATLDLLDGERTYRITGNSDQDAERRTVHRWSAPLLPLARLGTLVPASSGVRFAGGQVRDLEVVDGPSLVGRARIERGELTVGGVHALRGLHGELAIDGDGIGTRELDATLDDVVPLSLAGEVHQLPPHWRWLFEGNDDFRALERLLLAVAERPQLEAVRLEATAPGVAFAQFAMTTDHGPLAVHVLSIDPREPTLHFDTAIAQDHVISEGERTSAMGVRTGAIAGVNGDYFDIGRTYQPQGMLIRSGVLMRGPTDREALVIRRDHSVAFAEFKLRGTVRTRTGSYTVTQLNNWPAGDVTVITPDFGPSLPPASGVTFAQLAPVAGKRDRYRVYRIAPADAPQPIAFGLAFGPLAHAPPPRLGEIVELSYTLDPPIDGVVAGIGGGPLLLKDDEWYEDPHPPAPDERDVRWPVVALGRLADGHLYLVAVDGRHPERSVGMTRPEFAELLRKLGATDAMALDSGGSVTMVSRAPGDANVSIRNRPSDSSAERWVSDALFVYSSAPVPTIVPPNGAPTPIPETRPDP